MSAREENKARRRDAILDAAVALFGEHDARDVTTEQIATVAGVAPATVYNLIGTRDELMHSIVARVLDRLAAPLNDLDPADPLAAASLVVEQTVDAFTADSAAFRQIVAIAQKSPETERDRIDPSEFQVSAMLEAQRSGLLRGDVDAGGLGRQIYVSYMGALTLWANGWLDDAGFRTTARHGLVIALAAGGANEHRARFLEELGRLGAELDSSAWPR